MRKYNLGTNDCKVCRKKFSMNSFEFESSNTQPINNFWSNLLANLPQPDISYLEAIQSLPGDTPTEKFSWIAMFIKQKISECNSLEKLVESKEIPRDLVPLFQIEAAKILNAQNPEDQSNYEAIAEALKSEDSIIVCKALRAKRFFDGTNKKITNPAYFLDHLFPVVSLKTRLRIIKTLALRLFSKDPSLAEEFFTAISANYGIQQAMPLFRACSETFMYKTIEEHKIALPIKTVKILLYKNPDFVVSYLRLADKYLEKFANRDFFITNYFKLLPKLIKKRFESFVELYEKYDRKYIRLAVTIYLSRKSANVFLKKGKEHLLRRPHFFLEILPSKMVNKTLIETLLPRIIEDSMKDFMREDYMIELLKYVKYYPKEKIELFFAEWDPKIVRKGNFFNPENFNSSVMNLLPTEIRISVAQNYVDKFDQKTRFDYKNNPVCYLLAQDSIPIFKKLIKKTASADTRSSYLISMIYTCKVNDNELALIEVLKYWRDRHKNEENYFLLNVLSDLMKIYKISLLSEDFWAVLFEILNEAFVKNQLSNYTGQSVLEEITGFKLMRDLPIDKDIAMLVETFIENSRISWNIHTENPEYERKCLTACLEELSRKSELKNLDIEFYQNVIFSLYSFNDRHCKRNSRIEPMTIKPFQWLLVHLKGQFDHISDDFSYSGLIEKIEKYDMDVADSIWSRRDFDKIYLKSAMKLLKKNPKKLVTDYCTFLKCCQKTYAKKPSVIRKFLRATLWYTDVPIVFAKNAKHYNSAGIYCLAVLLGGKSFANWIELLLPTDTIVDVVSEDAKERYNMVKHILVAFNIANPPVPLSAINSFCKGDYLSLALRSLTNLCQRTSLKKVLNFAETLSNDRISAKKHAIRLLYMAMSIDQTCNSLISYWKVERHHSIREILFKKTCDVFLKIPRQTTWSLFFQVVSNLVVTDMNLVQILIQNISHVCDKYIAEYIYLSFKTIDMFLEYGHSKDKSVMLHMHSNTCSLLKAIDRRIINFLTEEFMLEILRKYLFHFELDVSESMIVFIFDTYFSLPHVNYELRLRNLSSVFTEKVKNYWDMTSIMICDYDIDDFNYPVKIGVHSLISHTVEITLRYNKKIQLVECITNTFFSVLSPQMDIESYLKLTYLMELISCSEIPKEFGIKMGNKISELIEIFSQFMLPTILKELNKFLRMYIKHCRNYEFHENFINGLLEVGTVEAALVIFELMDDNYLQSTRKEKLECTIKELKKYDHPVINSIICIILRKQKYLFLPKYKVFI